VNIAVVGEGVALVHVDGENVPGAVPLHPVVNGESGVPVTDCFDGLLGGVLVVAHLVGVERALAQLEMGEALLVGTVLRQ